MSLTKINVANSQGWIQGRPPPPLNPSLCAGRSPQLFMGVKRLCGKDKYHIDSPQCQSLVLLVEMQEMSPFCCLYYLVTPQCDA